MERSNECGKTEKRDEFQEKKTETNEIASDRESSIESFHTNKSEISTAETELIDVDDIELSDEESWLYKSPKKMSAEEKSLSTYKWLHKNVEEMDDNELQVAKSALVSKLNQLQMMKSTENVKESAPDICSKGCDKIEEKVSGACNSSKIETSSHEKNIATTTALCEQNVGTMENVSFIPPTKSQRECEAIELLEVQKIARLQEESLRQSTSKFLNQLEKRAQVNRSLSPAMFAPSIKLNKPASVEALNTCNEKSNQLIMSTLRLDQGMKKNFSFGSAASLMYHNQEILRGSLPNINKGYYSLRSKKKRSSDQKVPCPLPIYPYSKAQVNGSMNEMPIQSYYEPPSSVFDHQGSRTLPSSYRVRSKSNSSSRRDLSSLTPSPRRESSPFFPNQSIGSVFDMSRRESAPCNSRKFLSPASSPTLLQKSIGSTSTLQSPTKSRNVSQNRRLTNTNHSRTTSHSPSRRMPLTTVHNRSHKCENTPACYGEIRALKIPSKIPSPAARSGIPVPSCLTKANSADDSWSNDCF